MQIFGPPVEVQPSRRARRTDEASRLWAASEEAAGVTYVLSTTQDPVRKA
jgi:hypothetical protein